MVTDHHDAYEELIRAVAEALGAPEGSQWRGTHATIPAEEKAWHYESGHGCWYDVNKAARIAVTAMLAKLPHVND